MIPLLLLALGCLRDPLAFEQALDAEVCLWLAECYEEPEAACLEDAALDDGELPTSCEYDPALGRECVRQMRDLPCPQQTENFGFPAACIDAYGCG